MSKRLLIIGTGWLAVAAVFGRLGMLLSSFLVVRWLGEEANGLVTLAQTTILMSGGFIGAGLGMAATKLIADARSASPREAGSVILLFEWATIGFAAVAAAILYVCRNILAIDVLHAPQLANLFTISAPLLVITAWNLYQAGVLAGLEAYRETAFANALSGLASIPIIAVGIWLAGIHGAIIAQMASTAVSCFILHKQIHSACAASGIERRSLPTAASRRFLWRFGLPAVLLNSINAPTDWLSFAVVSRQARGISEIGVFNVGNQWCLMLRFLPMMIGAAMLPLAARTITARPARESRQLFLSGLGFVTLSCAPIVAIVAVLSPMIMGCYGPGMAERWPVLAILALSGMAIAVQTTADRFLVAIGAVWTNFYLSIARSILLLGWLLATDRGANGLSAARLASYSLSALASAALVFYLIARRGTTELKQATASALSDLRPLTSANESLLAA